MLGFYLSLIDGEDGKNKLTYIYEHYYALMLSVAREYSRNKSDIEDIVHECIIKIIKNLDKIDLEQETAAKCYICTIVKNHAKDGNKNKHNQFADGADISDLPYETSDDILEIILSDSGYRDLVGYINALGDTYRDVCNLKFICGLKEREIADILGITVSAVGARLVRARNILKKMIGEGERHDGKQ